MKNKVKPNKVKKIRCPKCGELLVKIYPWSSIQMNPNSPTPACGRCINKAL